MIDLNKLKATAEGDPKAKVTVNKAWLAEVHKVITGLQAELAVAKTGIGRKSNDDKETAEKFRRFFGA